MSEPKPKTPRPPRAPKKPAIPADLVGGTKMFAEREELDLDAEGYSKKRYKYLANGEVMRLKIVPNDVRGKTHKAKSQNLFWEGDEEEFRKHFDQTDEKDSAGVAPLNASEGE